MRGFLEYIPGDSLPHRLNPVAKVLFAVLFAIACFCSSDLLFLAIMFAAAIALAASCGLMTQTAGLMKAVLVFSLLLAILLLFTTPTGSLLIQLPWGYIGTGSVLAAIATILRLEAAAIPLFLVFYVTKMSDLSNAFVKVLRVPYRYAFTFASTVHFIPVFMNDMAAIMEAQTARGIQFDQGGILKKIRLMAPLCVPLLVNSVRKTNSAAIAAEVRGFDLRTRESGFKEYPMKATDWVVLALGVMLLAGAIALGLLG